MTVLLAAALFWLVCLLVVAFVWRSAPDEKLRERGFDG